MTTTLFGIDPQPYVPCNEMPDGRASIKAMAWHLHDIHEVPLTSARLRVIASGTGQSEVRELIRWHSQMMVAMKRCTPSQQHLRVEGFTDGEAAWIALACREKRDRQLQRASEIAREFETLSKSDIALALEEMEPRDRLRLREALDSWR